MPLQIDDVTEWDFIQYGYFNFDNIGTSVMSVFRVITLEGWTSVMYNYLDSSGVLAGIYFPVVVVIGSFFLLNLFLAVIMQTFTDQSNLQKQEELEKERKRLKRQKLGGDDGLLLGNIKLTGVAVRYP
jgi:voltage-gated sodium channel